MPEFKNRDEKLAYEESVTPRSINVRLEDLEAEIVLLKLELEILKKGENK